MAKIRLCIIEEQDLFREIYRVSFAQDPDIEITATMENEEAQAIVSTFAESRPEVVLMGTKALQSSTVEKLEEIRDSYPDMGLVLLSTIYDVNGIKRLRDFARKGSKGCAFLLKQSIDNAGQLTSVVHSVVNGQVILDSRVMEGLIEGSDPSATFLKELTNREVDVLNWMAKGYRNSTIAEILCLEPKTIERHINSIYSKLGGSLDSKHPRVSSIILYLRATGQMPSENFMKE